ncbi:hypothetical protein ACLB2K_013073 [Fragaria x ananassa]
MESSTPSPPPLVSKKRPPRRKPASPLGGEVCVNLDRAFALSWLDQEEEFLLDLVRRERQRLYVLYWFLFVLYLHFSFASDKLMTEAPSVYELIQTFLNYQEIVLKLNETILNDTEPGSSKEINSNVEGSQNGASFKQEKDASMGSQTTGMLQNPQYHQQLEDMLCNMTGSKVKERFDQIRLTTEQVSKIMANPDVAMAFQNSRVQAAIMDCSQNPTSITKYQNDKEVMDIGAFPRGVWLTLSRNSF